ncbi:MAG: hypothetical protein JWN86_3374 [Planctomycetota bacterium]|nr:hypothetical protein [Planctomycetota bacterium]
MRLRFRLTSRRVMVMVAVVGTGLGLGLWGMRMTRWARDCRTRAVWYASLGRYLMAEADEYRIAIEGGKSVHPDAKNFPRYVARERARGLRLLRLAVKYEHAARHPWLPVAPDPE